MAQDQVEEVKSKTDIVSVIGEHVELKKAGSNYKGLCPFHSEKTPSFMVSPELQIFKCFGCGESGDVLSFLEKYDGMDFPEALTFLAKRAGVKLKPFKSNVGSRKDRLYKINSFALHFYNYVLLKHSAGKKALQYLLKDRALEMETIKTFNLGFCPDMSLAIKSYVVDKKGVNPKELEEVGIAYLRDGRAYDRFRGRVIFPLFDHRGNVAGFAGRILPWEKNKDLAKYINTPETAIYHKSRLLYGLNITKSNIKKSKLAVIVEGELDMISSWQVGIDNTVAIKGSALTQEQTKLLARFTKEIVLALDADLAGDAAARRGISIAEDEGLEVKVAKLAGYKDPDDMARQEPEELKKAIKNSLGVWDYIVESVFERFDEESGEGKAKISKEIVPVLASIGDEIVQAHYVDRVAKKLGVPLEAVATQVSKVSVQKSRVVQELEVKPVKKDKSRKELLEERYLALVFRIDPSIISKKSARKFISSPLVKRIADEFKEYSSKNKNSSDLKVFYKQLPDELKDGFSDMVLEETDNAEVQEAKDQEKELETVEKELTRINLREDLERTGGLIKKYEEGGNRKKLKATQKKFRELTNELNKV